MVELIEARVRQFVDGVNLIVPIRKTHFISFPLRGKYFRCVLLLQHMPAP